MNAFHTVCKTDTSLSATINRAITSGFTLAVIGMVGVMTCAQYLAI